VKATAHYALAGDVHYITSSGNLIANAILGLASGPAVACWRQPMRLSPARNGAINITSTSWLNPTAPS